MNLVDTTPQAFVSVAEAARLTGVDVFTILRLAEDGYVPSEVRRVVDLDSLRRHLAANPQESA